MIKKIKESFNFEGKIVILGFGSIGQGILPLLDKYFNLEEKLIIIDKNCEGHDIAARYNVKIIKEKLVKENYDSLLLSVLKSGDFLLNLSVDVSSYALIELCQKHGFLYLDTCIEPWAGGYTDPNKSLSERSNYALREQILSLKKSLPENGATAVITHGANPGLVSHFVKQALINIAEEMEISIPTPKTRNEWAALACRLQIKSIHIAERDWQTAKLKKQSGEFVNTWSIDGFYSEGCQPAELGWGSHEKHWPQEGKNHCYGCQSSIFLNKPGIKTNVKTWTPTAGPTNGYLITHGEAISISDYLTLRDKEKNVMYRPTVHYSYHPCNDTVLSLHELVGKGFHLQENKRLLRDEIEDGADELGVLLMGHAKGAYWYGSQLTIQEARELVPYNSATTLQVTAGVLAGVIWAIENPCQGIVEPENMDFKRILEIANPYLGTMTGVYTDWSPLKDQPEFLETKIDYSDPWQFVNFLID